MTLFFQLRKKNHSSTLVPARRPASVPFSPLLLLMTI